jgi:hypothetical protein
MNVIGKLPAASGALKHEIGSTNYWAIALRIMAYQAGFRIHAQLEGGPCPVLECGSAARCAESLCLSGALLKEVRGEAEPRRVIQRSRVPVRQSREESPRS